MEKKAFSNPAGTAEETGHVSSDSGYNSLSDDEQGDFEKTIYEKKQYILMIPHILFWSVQSATSDVIDFNFQSQRELLSMVCQYLIEAKAVKTIPCSSVFFTTLMTYINRVIIVKPAEFLSQIVQTDLRQLGYTFEQFIEGWLTKMDMIVSQEANRINCLACYNLVPHFSEQVLKAALPEISKYTFTMLEHFLFLKLTDNKSRFHSPSRLQHATPQIFNKNPNIIKIRVHEKVSQRFDQMKREDPLLDFDLMDHFWQRIRELMTNLNITSV